MAYQFCAEIPGAVVGHTFATRSELRGAGVHFPPQSGISISRYGGAVCVERLQAAGA